MCRDAAGFLSHRLSLAVVLLASLIHTGSAFGITALVKARLPERRQREDLSEPSKVEFLSLLGGAQLPGENDTAWISNGTVRARRNASLPLVDAEAFVLHADDNASYLRTNSSAPALALMQSEAATHLRGNSSELNLTGDNVSDPNGTNLHATGIANKSMDVSAKTFGSALHAIAGNSPVRQLQSSSLLAVAAVPTAKSPPSEAASQHPSLLPFGSRALRSEQGARTVPVQSMDSATDLGRALEGGDGGGSMTGVLKIIIGIVVIALIMLVAVVIFDRTTAKSRAEATDASAQMRQWVRSLPVLCGDEVKRIFPERGGYDCLHLQPQAAPCAVRLEGRIAALTHNVLKAPLARNDCVLFTTSASTVRLDGVRAPPTAFYAMNSDFDLELDGTSPGSAEIRVRLRGQHVALFDVASGWRLERTVLGNAPEHLQDFLHVHRAPGTELPDANEVLDFTECLLSVGAHVTCVGELRRAPTGELGLWPLQNSDATPSEASNAREEMVYNSPRGLLSGLTSWERVGPPAQPCQSPRMGKVLISDDPRLFAQNLLFSSWPRWTRRLFNRNH